MIRSSVLTVLAFLAIQGASPISADDRLPTPISEAVEKGNTREVKRLLAIDPKLVKDDYLLYVAVALGHKETAELLLAKGADPNAANGLYETPLYAAAEHGHLEIMKMLVDKGASVSAGKDRGWTPLHIAIVRGRVEIAAWLIEHGSPLDVKTKSGQSLLHVAAQYSAAMVKLLAAKGANVDQRDRDGRGPLNWSIFSKKVETTAALLAAGADPNAKDKTGSTPLHAALGNTAMVELLLDNGAEANALITPGRSVLDVARDADVVKLLVKRGAATTQPLHEACQRGDLAEATRLLEKYPAFVNSRTQYDPRTLLHKAAASGNKPIAELLISKGANVDGQDGNKWTPLHAAIGARDWTQLQPEIAKGRAEVAALLIAKGATVDVRNRSKETPLHLAARYGTAELVQLLLKNGAEVNTKNAYGQTPLHIVVRKNQKTSAKHLIEAGADLSVKAGLHLRGWTPLHLGVLYGDREMVELLLSAGAPVDLAVEKGGTPLELAEKRRRKDGVIELLREARKVPETDGKGRPATKLKRAKPDSLQLEDQDEEVSFRHRAAGAGDCAGSERHGLGDPRDNQAILPGRQDQDDPPDHQGRRQANSRNRTSVPDHRHVAETRSENLSSLALPATGKGFVFAYGP